MHEIRADELLHDPNYAGHLDTSSFYDLCIAAGYSESEASKAASQRGYERLKAGHDL